MAYALNKSDNGLLVTLEDGIADVETTSLTLVGRNTPTYGERQNENFIRLLENFARDDAPGTRVGDLLGPPLTGQLWYNVTTKQINVYTGSGTENGWRPLAVLARGLYAGEPENLKTGDFYYATDRNELSVFNGTDLDFVGPINVKDNAGQIYSGNTRLIAERLEKAPSGTAPVVTLYVDGERLLVFNKGSAFSTAITGLTNVGQGLTLNSTLGKFNGVATDSDALGGFAASQYARTTATNVNFQGSVYVSNNDGLSVGTLQQTDYTFNPAEVGGSGTINNGVLSNNVDGGGWIIRTKKNGSRKNMIIINPEDDTVTINASLNVTGANPFVASRALKWNTARTISVTGIGTGSVSIDGSSDVTLNITPTYTAVNREGDTMTGSLALPVNGLAVGSNQLRVANNKVGVGNSDPETTLDVEGSMRVRVKADYAASGAINIDASASNNHLLELTGSATVTIANQKVGQIVRVTITGVNNGVAWTNTVRWPYGVSPDLSVGPTKTAVVTFDKPSPTFVLATYTIY